MSVFKNKEGQRPRQFFLQKGFSKAGKPLFVPFLWFHLLCFHFVMDSFSYDFSMLCFHLLCFNYVISFFSYDFLSFNFFYVFVILWFHYDVFPLAMFNFCYVSIKTLFDWRKRRKLVVCLKILSGISDELRQSLTSKG